MNKTSVVNIAFYMILLGIFFIPFNSWEGLEFLGEFYRDSCFLFFWWGTPLGFWITPAHLYGLLSPSQTLTQATAS